MDSSCSRVQTASNVSTFFRTDLVTMSRWLEKRHRILSETAATAVSCFASSCFSVLQQQLHQQPCKRCSQRKVCTSTDTSTNAAFWPTLTKHIWSFTWSPTKFHTRGACGLWPHTSSTNVKGGFILFLTPLCGKVITKGISTTTKKNQILHVLFFCVASNIDKLD